MKLKTFLAIMFSIILFSCSNWSKDKENFVETYKEILIVRLKSSDSSSSEKQLDKIYKKHGYSRASFKEQYFKFAEDHTEFMAILDTARARAQREILIISKSKAKLRSREE